MPTQIVKQPDSIEITKQMEPTIDRTENNPSGVKPIYYMTQTQVVTTPIDKDALLNEQATIKARLDEIEAILGKIEEADAAEIAAAAPAETEPTP